MVRFWLTTEPPSVAVTLREYVPAGVAALLVRVTAPLPLLPGSATWANVPLGTPTTAKVTGPEFPVTVVAIFAGVPSCGASAMEEERERLRAPGAPPEPGELPQAPRAKHRDAEQITVKVCFWPFISSSAAEHPRSTVVHPYREP